MSLKTALLFALVSTVTCHNDTSVNYMVEFFKTFTHAVANKDLTTLPALMDDHFYFMPCNGTKVGKMMGKEEFLDAVMDLPDNEAPTIEIRSSRYCRENPSIFCIGLRLVITGFGGRFDMASGYQHPTWGGGETGQCNPDY